MAEQRWKTLAPGLILAWIIVSSAMVAVGCALAVMAAGTTQAAGIGLATVGGLLLGPPANLIFDALVQAATTPPPQHRKAPKQLPSGRIPELETSRGDRRRRGAVTMRPLLSALAAALLSTSASVVASWIGSYF